MTKYIKKSIQDQAEQTEKSSRLYQLQYRMLLRLHILESVYIYCVYIVSRINSERNNNIHMLGWKFFPQSDNNKNARTKLTCANSFLALVLNHSPSRKLYICLKIISLSDKLSCAYLQSWMQWWTAVFPHSTVLGFHDLSSCWWYYDTSVSLINLIRRKLHFVRSFSKIM